MNRKLILPALGLFALTACHNGSTSQGTEACTQDSAAITEGPQGKLLFTEISQPTQPTRSLVDDQWGYRIVRPDIFDTPFSDEEGYSTTFLTPDGKVCLMLEGRINRREGEAKDNYAAYLKNIRSSGDSITFSSLHGDHFIISGKTSNGRIFYAKTCFCQLKHPATSKMHDVVTTAYTSFTPDRQKLGAEVAYYFKDFPN